MGTLRLTAAPPTARAAATPVKASLPTPGVDDGELVQSLARGLAVIETFGSDAAAQTLSDVARRAGLARATARRLLHTLVALGYAETDGRLFRLRPRVLDLGFSYLHAQGQWALAQPAMVALVEQVQESCSAAVLDETEIVYVARVPTRTRIVSVSLGLGSRLPAHATSMGRVLLAALPAERLDAVLARAAPLPRHTERSITDPRELRRALRTVREQGFSLVDQEFEPGLRSIAVPLHDAAGRTVAALNVGTHASRLSVADLERRVLPSLKAAAGEIERAWGAAS